MEPNLFEQAKEMMMNFTSEKGHQHEDKEIIKRAIKAAYSVATEEEKEELQQFEQQLDEYH